MQTQKKKVLVVDDAVVVRRVLTQAINQDPDLEVSGTAANGRLALSKFRAPYPDIVLLDVEMPEMDGLETVRELRKLDRRIPIIMFSTLTERGASVTLEALALGATDYVTKPSNFDGNTTLDAVLKELIPKIRILCHLSCVQSDPPTLRLRSPTNVRSPLPRILTPVKIIVIGVSTGGPDALARILPLLPREFPVPLLIAQHMPPIFTTMLAARLTAKSQLPTRECAPGEPLVSGCAFLAPGDFHMVVEQEHGSVVLKTHQGARENFCRPSVDVLFRSVAQIYADRALAVVLTGMGQDGLRGCEMLHNLGARVYVQDEASSVVWGMPGFVARAGLADKILPLNQIASEIVQATSMQLRVSLSAE